MWLTIIRFCSLFFTGLAMSAALAHLFELPNKINLSKDDYLTVQQIYRGWALLGIVVIAALLSTLILAIMVRKEKRIFALTLIALLCIVGTQIIFWIFTYPANKQTNNWTMLPANWFELRKQWEYSHAISAVLDMIALITLIISILLKHKSFKT
jgi:hypothetical protein